MHVCTYVLMFVCMNSRTYACMHVLYVHTYVCMYECMHVFTYVFVYVCMYACLYERGIPESKDTKVLKMYNIFHL